MAVETRGTVQLRGDPSSSTAVLVEAGPERLRLLAGGRPIGDWEVGAIGIKALMEGFAIRAEGEDLLLHTEDDVAVAEALGLQTASPRLARLIAAAHPPPERADATADDTGLPDFGPIALVYALAGLLVVMGGTLLRQSPTLAAEQRGIAQGLSSAGRFWFGFLLAGVAMIVVAYALVRSAGWARPLALATVVGLIVVLGLAASSEREPAAHLFAYGFIAAGLVAGVAMLFTSPLEGS